MPLWFEVLLYLLATGSVLACVIIAACGIVSSRISRSEERFTRRDIHEFEQREQQARAWIEK